MLFSEYEKFAIIVDRFYIALHSRSQMILFSLNQVNQVTHGKIQCDIKRSIIINTSILPTWSIDPEPIPTPPACQAQRGPATLNQYPKPTPTPPTSVRSD
jgi:hypothetical protein